MRGRASAPPPCRSRFGKGAKFAWQTLGKPPRSHMRTVLSSAAMMTIIHQLFKPLKCVYEPGYRAEGCAFNETAGLYAPPPNATAGSPLLACGLPVVFGRPDDAPWLCWSGGSQNSAAAASMGLLVMYGITAALYGPAAAAHSEGASMDATLDARFSPLWMLAEGMIKVLVSAANFFFSFAPVATNLLAIGFNASLALWALRGQPCCVGWYNQLTALANGMSAWVPLCVLLTRPLEGTALEALPAVLLIAGNVVAVVTGVWLGWRASKTAKTQPSDPSATV